jgi:ubiquinone/menaquinone biosynthesis C-methylase UbiE
MPGRPTIAPRLYSDLADWFHLLTSPKDYKDEAKWIAAQLKVPGVKKPTLLELGSGGGNNAVHLKKHFEMTLTDLSPQMLKLSKRINPELPHKTADMRTLRLGKEFDCVLIHDAIMYMTSARDLSRAIKSAALHLKPGGALLIQPDFLEETFQPMFERGGHKGEGRALEYVESDKRRGTSNKVDVQFTIKLTENGKTRLVADRHVVGVFTRKTWTDTIKAAGLTVKRIGDPYGRENFLCRKPETA